MSLYRECSKAVDRLMSEPPAQHGGVFTEIDVVAKAATRAWTNDNFTEAQRHANQVCGTKYRERKLCRYGPITLPDGTQDYARIASKIVYADAATGPDEWVTPNGAFPKLMIEDDPLVAQGRRRGTTRNDLVLWRDEEAPMPENVAELRKRIRELEDSLALASRRAEAAERRANGNPDMARMIEDLQTRVEILEQRDRMRAEIAAA